MIMITSEVQPSLQHNIIYIKSRVTLLASHLDVWLELGKREMLLNEK